MELLEAAHIPVGDPDDIDPADAATIVAARMTRAVAKPIIGAMAQHRLWNREAGLHLPL